MHDIFFKSSERLDFTPLWTFPSPTLKYKRYKTESRKKKLICKHFDSFNAISTYRTYDLNLKIITQTFFRHVWVFFFLNLTFCKKRYNTETNRKKNIWEIFWGRKMFCQASKLTPVCCFMLKNLSWVFAYLQKIEDLLSQFYIKTTMHCLLERWRVNKIEELFNAYLKLSFTFLGWFKMKAKIVDTSAKVDSTKVSWSFMFTR